jgi:hypothetical protein
MNNVWDKYSSGVVTSGTILKLHPENEKLLPCLTVCTFSGFKSPNFYYSGLNYDDETYTLSEIFHDISIAKLNNSEMYQVKETRGFYFGKCYTICCLITFSAKSYSDILFLKKSLETTIFIHQKYEEFWLEIFDLPQSVWIRHTEDSVQGIELSLTEKRKINLNKDGDKCLMSYSESDSEASFSFINCCRNQFWKSLAGKTNCSLSGLELKPFVEKLPKCVKTEDIKHALSIYVEEIEDFYKNTEAFGCLKPCVEITYDVAVKYYHRNVLFELDFEALSTESFALTMTYKTTQVEESIERLTYDDADFLIYLGGNLGLFLGLSCLSTLLKLVDYLQKSISELV